MGIKKESSNPIFNIPGSRSELSGKEKCKVLKKLRQEIAEEHDIEGFDYKECPYEGQCKGTCPACDAELSKLTIEVKAKKKKGFLGGLFSKKPKIENKSNREPINRPVLIMGDVPYEGDDGFEKLFDKNDSGFDTFNFGNDTPVRDTDGVSNTDILMGDTIPPDDTFDNDKNTSGNIGDDILMGDDAPFFDEDEPECIDGMEMTYEEHIALYPESANIDMEELEKLAREQNESNES